MAEFEDRINAIVEGVADRIRTGRHRSILIRRAGRSGQVPIPLPGPEDEDEDDQDQDEDDLLTAPG